MKRFLLIAVGLALLGAPARAGYDKTEWGMSPEQVAQALGPERAAQVKPYAIRDGGWKVANRGVTVLGEDRLPTTYEYEDGKLVLILMQQKKQKNCAAAVRHVQLQLGNPYRISDQVILRLIIWHDPARNTRVRLLVSTSICDLHYEPLDQYIEADRAAVAGG